MFCCFAITLPPFFKTLSLFLLFIALIATGEIKKTKIEKGFWSFYNPLLISVLLYLIYCIGMLYTQDLAYGLQDLQIKLPLLVLPILMLFLPKSLLAKDKLWSYASAFMAGLILIMLCCVVKGFAKAFSGETFNIQPLTYAALSGKLGVSPAYMALAITISILLLYKKPIAKIFNITPLLAKIIRICVFGFLVLFLIFLKSKAGWLCFYFTNLSLIIDLIIKRKMIRFIGFVIVLLGIIFIVANFNILSDRYKAFIVQKHNHSETFNNSISERQIIYSHYPELFVQNLPFGVGTGDTRGEMSDCLIKRFGVENIFLNAHNQFLQTAIAIGTPGLLTLLWLYLIFVIKFWNKQQWWLISIVAICGISMLFESMLERQQGVFYFVFVICLLYPLIQNNKGNYSEDSSALSTDE
jgi:O-antigen ligase